MFQYPLILSIILLLLACKPALQNRLAPAQGAAGSFISAETANSEAMAIDIPPMIYLDAEVNTFGILSLSVKNAKGPLIYQRFLAVDNPAAINAAERHDLKRICRDMSLASEAMNPSPTFEVKADQTYFLQWRSHYPIESKKRLGAVLAAGRQVRCVLQFKDPSTGQRAQVLFNPLAEDGASVKGVVNRESALKEGLLLVEGSKGLINEGSLLLVEEAASIRIGVKAINRGMLTLKDVERDSTACSFVHEAGKMRLANPGLVKRIDVGIHGMADFAVRKIQEVPLGGRVAKACSDVRVTYKHKDLQSQFSCDTYLGIKDEGLEGGCRWEVTVENSMDPDNDQILNLTLSHIAFDDIDLKPSMEPLPAIPQSRLNPVRGGKVKMENFPEEQASMTADAFDLWLAVDSHSYRDDFESSVPTLRYLRDAETCVSTMGRDPIAGGTAINLCDLGAYAPQHQKKRRTDPFGPLLRSQILAHESRHIKGYKHDWLADDYSPCEGAAASAVLPYRVAVDCTSEFCPVLRDAAFHLFLHELNHSLRGDARRFQGQCKSWSDKMGLTMADIPIGK